MESITESQRAYLCTHPLRLKENRVWRTYSGGRMIGAWRNRQQEDGHTPEDWVGSTTRAVNASHPGPEDEGLSRIDGRAAGLSFDPVLIDVIRQAPQRLLGSAHVRLFGDQTALLVKVLDAAERLAIQAHPDRADARRYFSSPFGKTEAWYVLDVRRDVSPEPSVLLGFREDMDRAAWRRLFESQDIAGMQRALHRFPVSPGDVLLIEGGVPHAIGEGCFLIEIQEPTDYTLRVERVTPRGLVLSDQACHQGAGFDAMLSMFHYDFLTREQTLARWRIPPKTLSIQGGGQIDQLLGPEHTPCFSLIRMHVTGELPSPAFDRFQIAIVVSGSGLMCLEDEEIPLERGACFFLPAHMRKASLRAKDMTVLLCRPPLSAPESNL